MTGPLWALVIMLDEPEFRPNYEAGRREFGCGRWGVGWGACQGTHECSCCFGWRDVVSMLLGQVLRTMHFEYPFRTSIQR